MRLEGYNRKDFTAVVYNWTGTLDNRNYSFSGPINGTLLMSSSTRATMYVDAPVQWRAILQEVKDRGGNEIFPGGQWDVTWVQPRINLLGYAEGYELTLAVIQ